MPYDPALLIKTLRELRLINEQKLEAAIAKSTTDNKPLDDVLVTEDLISDENLGKIIADLIKCPFVSLAKTPIENSVLKLIPESVAKRNSMVVFAGDVDGYKIATSNPYDAEMVRLFAQKVNAKVETYYATSRDIEKTLAKYKGDLQNTFDILLSDKVKIAPIAEVVNLLIEYAYENRASDIHIEPERDRSIVRFRIDGILQEVLSFPKDLHDQIISRLKVVTGLKIDEHSSAQDGKMRFKLPAEEFDIRVSIVPIVGGEKAELRLLSLRFKQFGLADLGMSSSDLKKVEAGFNKPYGMVLATGPTGSGKTTTIYSILKILNTKKVNIATIEDPVEYEIPGVNQIQVNPTTNLTFAEGLRSILRQDPNIIFVGEIRDEETAGIAVNSATTGHLVLSTLHTNDAATTLPRLMDMGIEAYLVTTTVNIIIAQRLVRKICESCRVSAGEVKFHPGDAGMTRIYKGKGCPVCKGTGYLGRIGLFEVLTMDEIIGKLVTAKATSDEIRDEAIKRGMTTMLEDGLAKVRDGLTTLEEVMGATK